MAFTRPPPPNLIKRAVLWYGLSPPLIQARSCLESIAPGSGGGGDSYGLSLSLSLARYSNSLISPYSLVLLSMNHCSHNRTSFNERQPSGSAVARVTHVYYYPYYTLFPVHTLCHRLVGSLRFPLPSRTCSLDSYCPQNTSFHSSSPFHVSIVHSISL